MENTKQPSVYYTASGQCVLVNQRIDDKGFIGSAVYEVMGCDGRGEDIEAEVEDKPRYWAYSDVYVKVPTAKLHARIVDLNIEIKERRDDIDKLRSDFLKDKEAALSARMRVDSITRRMSQLSAVELFLNDGITHYVITSSAGFPEIVNAGDRKTRCGGDATKRALRLISFTGTAGREKSSWQVNQYSDGSGYNEDIRPCASEDDARKVAGDIVSRLLKDHPNHHQLPKLVEAANEYGIAVGEGVMKAYSQEIERVKKLESERKADKLAKLQNEITKLKSEQ